MAATISSPPYETDALGHSRGQAGLIRDGVYGTPPATEYGSTPGQLGAMRSGDFAAAVSSPPYADAVNGTGEGPGARHDPVHHNGDNAHKISSDNGYGTTPGNVGHMPDRGFEAVVERNEWLDKATSALFDALSGAAQAAQEQEQSETFWAAARAIVEQTYAALRPGGYAAWVTKDFVRKGQRVPFSDQWQALCAAVGFVPVERIAAMLVDDHGDQLDIFGGVTARRKERKSFFRRLAEKKGSPRIDHEDVIIMRKPVTE
jgi:hypothetical protein